nr:Gamma-glutamyl phosphate reductase [Candidatus Pantoea persica]
MEKSTASLTIEGVSVRHNVFRIESLDIGQKSAYSLAARDEFVETIHAIEYGIDEARVLLNGRPAENIRLIAINSDSMTEIFAPRDQLFVNISVNMFDGDGIYIFTLDNQLYLKRLHSCSIKNRCHIRQ